MRNSFWRKFWMLLGCLVAIVYLCFRAFFTLNLTSPFAIFLSIFLFIGECYTVQAFLLYVFVAWDPQDPPAEPVLEGRSVDILVLTYNEDVSILRGTLQACQRLDYPHTTYLLDDGRRPAMEALARELGCQYITRPDNRHAKAGNLNNALGQTNGEFVMVLDADHVPESNFISRLLGYFKDEKLGFVQVPHAYYNFDSFQARFDPKNKTYWEEGQMFHELLQTGRNYYNAAAFVGSGTIFRRKALEEIGGFATETITEDTHTSIRIHARGWKTLAVRERLMVGQAAPDVTTFHVQRLRWAEGNLSIFAYDNPLTVRGLTIGQRLCYFAQLTYFASGGFRLIMFLIPILCLFTGIPPVAGFAPALLIAMLVYMTVALWTFHVSNEGYGGYVNYELMIVAAAFTQIRGIFRAMFRRRFQKFIVSSKRGRSSKSIWPYIWPQVGLIGLTILALVWGWSRPLFGLTHDYAMLVVMSAWAVYHIIFSVAVLYRSLWPESPRFGYRHQLSLPVAYSNIETGEGPTFGTTMDLNDAGLALVAYQQLTVGSKLRLAIHCGKDTVHCQGHVRWVRPITSKKPGGTHMLAGYRCGIAFLDLTPVQADELNRMCFQYGVARMYHSVDGRVPSFWARMGARFLTPFRGNQQASYAYHLPLVLWVSGEDRPFMFTLTEEIGPRTMTVFLEHDLPAEGEICFQLPLPSGDIQGTVRVLTRERRELGTRDYERCVLEFVDLDEEGRATLGTILRPSARSELESILSPVNEPLRVPILRPALLAASILVPLVALELGLFWTWNRDDMFLLHIAHSPARLTPDEDSRLEGVYGATIAQSSPTSQRLLLLNAALMRVNSQAEAAQAAAVLPPRDPAAGDSFPGLDLRDGVNQPVVAEADAQRLLAEMKRGKFPVATSGELLLAAARVSARGGRYDMALPMYRQVVADYYANDPAVRNELAEVLLRMGRLREASEVYRGVEPNPDGRLLLATAHFLANDYKAAEQECRTLLAQDPNNERARKLLEDAERREKSYTSSRQVLDRLLKVFPKDQKLRVELGLRTLESNNYSFSLDLFQQLFDQGNRQGEVLRGYLDAAGGSVDVGAIKRETVLDIARMSTQPPLASDPVYLARLAWVLQRIQEPDESLLILQRAMATDAEAPELRQQYVEILLAADRWQEARKYLQNHKAGIRDRQLLIGLYLRGQDFDEAEKECRALLKEQPDDFRLQLLLVDILSWKKEYAQSLAMLAAMRQKWPDDRAIPVRQAEVTLWSGDYAAAMVLYQEILEKSFERPLLWRGFVDSASGAPTLNEAQARLANRIAERTLAAPPREVLFLSRLAWVLHRLGESTRSLRLLHLAVKLGPENPEVRRELAGVLAAVGEYKLAIAMYQGQELDLKDRLLVAQLHMGAKSLDAAEAECRTILSIDPGNRQAESVLADVLTWGQKYPEAVVLLKKLRQGDPENEELALRYANVLLWSKDYAAALPEFHALLSSKALQADAVRGFLDAASGVEKLDPKYRKPALAINDDFLARKPKDAVVLGRLAWILRRLDEPNRSVKLLELATALAPSEREFQLQLADALYAAGNYEEATRHYKRLLE